MPTEQIHTYLERPLRAYTRFTVTDPDLIVKRLAATRQDGYCWVYEEFAEGINSVAAPVHDAGRRAVAAISVHGPSYRFPPVGDSERVAEVVKLAARRLSLQIETM